MSEKDIVNLTPHQLNVFNKDEEKILSLESQGIVRVSEEKQKIGEINGVPLVRKKFTETKGLPEPKEDTYYFVSIIVIQANPSRDDLITSSDLVRDENGQILGCKEFSQL